MADLQAEIELTVELRKFCNIDLFVQGYYQIRTGVKFAPRIQSTTKVELKSECPSTFDDSNDQLYPACVFNECGVSKTFLIIYKNEEIQLEDQVNFKISVIVDAQNLTESFQRMDMQLLVELYFIERDYSPEKMSTMQQLCSRCYKLHFNPRLGIHTHVPIVFDYFHLSALTTTIHASLLCLIPPYVFDRPNVQRTSLFSFLFGQDLSQITTDQLSPSLLDRAYHLHNNICEILLSSYESVQDFYEKMIEYLPENVAKPAHVHQKCRQKLKILSDKLKTLDDIHTIDNLAHAHIAQCSAENIMLWGQFIQTFGLQDSVAIVIAKEYHLKRVKRLSEGFFLRETSRINLLTNESDTHNDLHELVRNSSYYARLPHLPIECVELDGVPDTLPILIEEVYSPIDQLSALVAPLLKTTPNNGNATTQTASSSGLYVPNLAPLSNVVTNETRRKDVSNTLLSSPPKSPKEFRSMKKSTSNDKIDPKAAPIVHQSSRPHMPFRNNTGRNVNPVLALSNDPFVELTRFRKFEQGAASAVTDKSTASTQSAESNTFAPSSDCDIQPGVLHRSNSSRSFTRAARRSLPNEPFPRSNSSSSVRTDLTDSSTIPPFLCATSDRSQEDDVFSRQEQDSAFDDSSLKSKVLRESFRGKANTMDRRTAPTSARSLSTSSVTHTAHPRQSPDSEPKRSVTENEANRSDYPSSTPADDIHPVMLNGLTDEENTLNSLSNTSSDSPSLVVVDSDLEQSADSNKQRANGSVGPDRIQTNPSINSQTIEYVVHKEKLKQLMHSKHTSNFVFYSDLSTPISTIPYFYHELVPLDSMGVHLIVCVHGLDGNSGDLRLMKTYLELCLPASRLDFLMSSSNHSSTFDDIDVMVKQLIDEIDTHIDRYGLKPQRISFIGHSLGNLIVRAVVSDTSFERYRPFLYTYLSLSGPHLGTLFNTSGLVNMGMWLMQKWKKSFSLAQMSFKDHLDPKQTYLYKLSKKPCLEFFKNILLIASPQDRYVPFHSARIEVCKAALKDTVYGSVYVEMISNLLEPIIRNPAITFVRYNAFHNIPTGTNNFIGRAAHIAILDSELFVEKLILVSAAKYFK